MKAKSLQDLAAMRKHLADREQAEREQAAARAEAQRRTEAERNLFQRAAGAVQRVPQHGRVHHVPQPPAPIPAQRQLDDQRVLQESREQGSELLIFITPRIVKL